MSVAIPVHSQSYIDTLKGIVDDRIASVLAPVRPPALRRALEEALAGGKRIRPILTVLACAAAGGKEADALPIGIGVELLHGASLLHDDIMDNSSLRRGEPTMHVRYGVPAGIVAGDMLVALATQQVLRAEHPRMPDLLMEFSATFVALCEGQSHDIGLSAGNPLDAETHREMVRMKTAELLASAVALGAMVATDDTSAIEALRRFGLNLGMAYQAKDDLLDATGTEETLGKTPGIDERNGRRTYLTMAYPAVRTTSVVESLVREYTDRALLALDVLPPTRARTTLASLACALVERDR
jgi:geranylgeranyl pyrophosphate synthase